jgi:hypothetical protein
MSESTQDVSTLDGRLAGIDRRLREIQAELLPERVPHDVPAPEPALESGDAARLDQITQLTAVYGDLLVSLRELLERHQPPQAVPGAGERVTVSTGPFRTIGAVRAFEQRLATLPGVGDVHLRGYEGDDRAVFDVRLGGDSS